MLHAACVQSALRAVRARVNVGGRIACCVWAARPALWLLPAILHAQSCTHSRSQVHYGHSCLVPVDVTSLPCMYVFVDIQMDVQHLVDSVK